VWDGSVRWSAQVSGVITWVTGTILFILWAVLPAKSLMDTLSRASFHKLVSAERTFPSAIVFAWADGNAIKKVAPLLSGGLLVTAAALRPFFASILARAISLLLVIIGIQPVPVDGARMPQSGAWASLGSACFPMWLDGLFCLATIAAMVIPVRAIVPVIRLVEGADSLVDLIDGRRNAMIEKMANLFSESSDESFGV